ncbi:hypothetical protein K0M31_001911 [Melipona bicolor]|uniref:Uncharacterized protein n=1 Tax=Melipona bicolor TaxID=60889 RepID=A0AA40GGJ1_9HYME|nr:hypothetical protein K0M31_001911 [Melipona bicolor]
MSATTVDIFTSLCSNSRVVSKLFSYSDIDINWTAVPVSNEMIDKSCLIPYIASFMTSDIWSGTVNHLIQTGRPSPDELLVYNETLMPCINNIDVPGVNRVMRVITPLWKGNNNIAVSNFGALWKAYWTTDNENIENDGELYGAWYQGIGFTQDPSGCSSADHSSTAFGCWSTDTKPLDKNGLVKPELFTTVDKDKMLARRRTMAYNFSHLTPLHNTTIGLRKVHYIMLLEGYLSVTWKDTSCSYPTYNISTMSSVWRIGTAMGLVLTTDYNSIGFNNSSSMSCPEPERRKRMLVREPGSEFKYVMQWVNQVSYYSNIMFAEFPVKSFCDMYESMTTCVNVQVYPIMYLPMCSTIEWPDPPLIDTLWTRAKNYLLKSALTSFLTGGVSGALIAGSAAVANQLVRSVTNIGSQRIRTEDSEDCGNSRQASSGYS